ncbi:ISKra4 family transposase, partial [Streptomyces sp. H27-D2]|nr:ISKra4 family transposase [Streptomyces sp. H27-D2]
GRELLRRMVQDQLDARAVAEVRLESVTGADGVERRRAERGHRRLLTTTLGRVEVVCIAYRAPGAGNLHPADAVLALPPQLYSGPLQREVVHQGASGSLRATGQTLERTTGQRLGSRQLMEVYERAAADIPAFYQAVRQNPPRRPEPAAYWS